MLFLFSDLSDIFEATEDNNVTVENKQKNAASAVEETKPESEEKEEKKDSGKKEKKANIGVTFYLPGGEF